MSDEPPPPSPFPHGGPNPEKKPEGQGNPGAGGPDFQRIQHASNTARIPEKVTRGAMMATGVLVIQGPQEFVLDFVQAVNKPVLVARVVVPPHVVEQILGVMQENYGRYVTQFGAPPAMPKPPPNERPKTPQELYDELKISEDHMSGVYANAAMVGHTPAEFHIDFVTTFFPQAAVSSRVYIAAPRMTGIIETLSMSIAQRKRAIEQQQRQPPQPPQGPGPSGLG